MTNDLHSYLMVQAWEHLIIHQDVKNAGGVVHELFEGRLPDVVDDSAQIDRAQSPASLKGEHHSSEQVLRDALSTFGKLPISECIGTRRIAGVDEWDLFATNCER